MSIYMKHLVASALFILVCNNPLFSSSSYWAASAQSGCSMGYQSALQIEGASIELSYTVLLDDLTIAESGPTEEPQNGTISVQMVYSGLAWIGLGTAASDKGLMPDGEAVIGYPRQNSVKKYNLPSRSGIVLAESQTLSDESIEQDINAGTTILRYKKRLLGAGEHDIHGNGSETTFLWAVGSGNSISRHSIAGAFTTRLVLCVEGSDAENVSIKTIDNRPSFNYWVAHGVLVGTAWGLLAPLAILASVARDYLPKGGIWLQLHKYLHTSVAICTFIALILAIIAIGDEGGPSSPDVSASEYHKFLGFTIIIIMVVQNISGLARPAAPKRADSKRATEEVSPPNIANNNELQEQATAKTQVRRFWEIGHRTLGVVLLSICWYQVSLGYRLLCGISMLLPPGIYPHLRWDIPLLQVSFLTMTEIVYRAIIN